jgi:hypothetical protein
MMVVAVVPVTMSTTISMTISMTIGSVVARGHNNGCLLNHIGGALNHYRSLINHLGLLVNDLRLLIDDLGCWVDHLRRVVRATHIDGAVHPWSQHTAYIKGYVAMSMAGLTGCQTKTQGEGRCRRKQLGRYRGLDFHIYTSKKVGVESVCAGVPTLTSVDTFCYTLYSLAPCGLLGFISSPDPARLAEAFYTIRPLGELL